MTKVDVIKVVKAIIDVVDSMEMHEGRISNCGKTLLVIIEIVLEFIDPPKENSAQDDLRRAKIMIESKFMPTKVKSSEIGLKGLFMKMLMFMLVFIVKILDVQIIENGSVLRMTIIFFYIFNESISLLENVRNLGMPFLAKLKSVLEQLHDRLGKIRGLGLVKLLLKTIPAIMRMCHKVTRNICRST